MRHQKYHSALRSATKYLLDTYIHVTALIYNKSTAEKIGGFIESAMAMPTPEPPDPSEESWRKVVPFEKVG